MSDATRSSTNVLVIGAGPGGYVAAIRAAQLGRDVTLVEKDAYGGTCLNYGCIPSKALISASGLAYDAREAGMMGIDADVDVDFNRMVGWKDGIVDRLTDGVEHLCQSNGVRLVDGHAAFEDDRTVAVTDGDGEVTERISFKHAVLATGSRPIEVSGFEFADDPVLDARQALALSEVPDRLVVIGGGYIGMELSTVFATLGSDVTVIEMLDDILPNYDDDLTVPAREHAARLGVDFHFCEMATKWYDGDDGSVVVTETEGGATSEYPTDRILVAVGRQPVTGTLNLEAAGLEPEDAGHLETDVRQRTDVDEIFAIGDVAGDPMLAHVASAEGRVAAEVIAGGSSDSRRRAVPSVVFTRPEIGTVGLTAGEARESGFEPAVGEFPFEASGRALTTGHAEGFVRVVADGERHYLIGAQIVGPDASELIAELALGIEMELTLEDVATTVHTHPTLSEAVAEACENAFGRAIHTTNSRR